jgi:hypothetical protein
MIAKIALDADGVLMDLVSAVFYWFRPEAKAEDERAFYDSYPKGSYEISAALGMTYSKCWFTLDCPAFWKTVAPYDDAHKFVNAVLRVANEKYVKVILVTRMTRSPETASAKLQALSAFGLPTYLVWNGSKEPFDDCKTLLVDDCDGNIDAWVGPSILFPQIINSAWRDAGEPRKPCYDKVLEKIREHLKRA